MILSEFYKAMLERLMDADIEIQYFDLWNDQIVRNEDDDDDLAFNYPAVFLEFEPIEWETLGRKKQAAEVNFNLLVASENYHETSSVESDEEIDKGLLHLNLIDDIFALLQGFNRTFENGSGFGSITRTGTRFEHEGSNMVIVHGMPFKCRMTDVAAIAKKAKSILTEKGLKQDIKL